MDILTFIDEFAFLSNFHRSEVRLDGVTYPTVEHAFQAAKTSDQDERRALLECSSPGRAKRMGKRVKLRSDWEMVKIGIMESLVREKFTAHPELREALLATGERRLVEGNNWGDTFWGTVGGRGQNHLGEILIRVRAELAGGAP